MPVSPSLLEILCCPAVHAGNACHGDLVQLKSGLQCQTCGLVYPIENGIPILLPDSGIAKDSPLYEQRHKLALEEGDLDK